MKHRGPIRLVLASGNQGKVRELREALTGRGLRLVSASDVGVTDFPPEDGIGYDDNALLKAGHVVTHTGLPALADDSGLEVDALDGAPGVHSARFGGDGLSDGERVAHLLARLRGVPEARRTARFVSVLVLATPQGEVFRFEGRCEGRILEGPRGGSGFGYDPVFWSDELQTTFGQADLGRKQAVSHRGRALEELLAWLSEPDAMAVLRGEDRGDDAPPDAPTAAPDTESSEPDSDQEEP